jgi:hypothetical protein
MPNLAGVGALQVFAGPRASDIHVVAAAAGGPKGLVLNPLDRFLFGHWLKGCARPVHLLGASIGAWRLAAACLDDADAALAEMAEHYIVQRYAHAPGKTPRASHVSEVIGATLRRRFDACAAQLLTQTSHRLHVFTSRSRGPLARKGRIRTPLG